MKYLLIFHCESHQLILHEINWTSCVVDLNMRLFKYLKRNALTPCFNFFLINFSLIKKRMHELPSPWSLCQIKHYHFVNSQAYQAVIWFSGWIHAYNLFNADFFFSQSHTHTHLFTPCKTEHNKAMHAFVVFFNRIL